MVMYAKPVDPASGKVDVFLGTDFAWASKRGFTEQDVEQSTDGTWYLAGQVPPLVVTEAEQRGLREAAYRAEVDPITAHIVRLRDMEPASEEIPELVEQRAQKVDEIRARYPYPEEVA